MTLGVGNIRRPRATDLGFIKRTELVLGLLTHLSLADKTVLDVGCGNGVYTLNIAKLAQTAIGMDIARDGLREAREDAEKLKVTAQFAIANAECLPIRDSSCDVVLVMEALEHIQNPETTLKEAKRVLKSQGYLVVSVPNRLYPLEIHYIRIGKTVIRGVYGQVPFFSWAPRYIRKRFQTARVYTKKEITEIIQETGLVACRVHYSAFPRLDMLGNKTITQLCDRFFTRLEHNAFFKQFGMVIFVLAQKR